MKRVNSMSACASQSYKAKYLRGHSAFPKEIKKTTLVFNTDFMEIPELSLKIPYLVLTNVQIYYELMPGPPTGFVGVFLGASRAYYVQISYKDETGSEQNLCLEFGARNEKLNCEVRQAIACRKFIAAASVEYPTGTQSNVAAAVLYERAAELAAKGEDYGVAGMLYRDAGDRYKSINCTEKVIEVYEKAGDNFLIGCGYYMFFNAWRVYIQAGFAALSVFRLKKANVLAEKAIGVYNQDRKQRLNTLGGALSISIVCKLLSEGHIAEAKEQWGQLEKRGYIKDYREKGGEFFDLIESGFKVATDEGLQEEAAKNTQTKEVGLWEYSAPSDNIDLKEVWIWDFRAFLNNIGFKADIEGSIQSSFSQTKGLIKLEGANINYIVKDISIGSPVLIFVIDDLKEKIKLDLKINIQHGKIEVLKWTSKNEKHEKLAETLNNDQNLMAALSTEIEHGNLNYSTTIDSWRSISIEGQGVLSLKQHSILIQHSLKKLPSKEYFEAMDKVANLLRKFP